MSARLASRRRLSGSRCGADSAIQRLNATKVVGAMVLMSAILPVAEMTPCSNLGASINTHSSTKLMKPRNTRSSFSKRERMRR